MNRHFFCARLREKKIFAALKHNTASNQSVNIGCNVIFLVHQRQNWVGGHKRFLLANRSCWFGRFYRTGSCQLIIISLFFFSFQAAFEIVMKHLPIKPKRNIKVRSET